MLIHSNVFLTTEWDLTEALVATHEAPWLGSYTLWVSADISADLCEVVGLPGIAQVTVDVIVNVANVANSLVAVFVASCKGF